jgi:hypothetical protein
MPPFATTGGISGAELKAASRNTALFITPGSTPKFRMDPGRWDILRLRQQTLGRPLQHRNTRN